MQVRARNESRHGYLRDLAERYCKSTKRARRRAVANNDIKGTVWDLAWLFVQMCACNHIW